MHFLLATELNSYLRRFHWRPLLTVHNALFCISRFSSFFSVFVQRAIFFRCFVRPFSPMRCFIFSFFCLLFSFCFVFDASLIGYIYIFFLCVLFVWVIVFWFLIFCVCICCVSFYPFFFLSFCVYFMLKPSGFLMPSALLCIFGIYLSIFSCVYRWHRWRLLWVLGIKCFDMLQIFILWHY